MNYLYSIWYYRPSAVGAQSCIWEELACWMIQLKKSAMSWRPLGSMRMGIMLSICMVWLSLRLSLQRYTTQKKMHPTTEIRMYRARQMIRVLVMLETESLKLLLQTSKRFSRYLLTQSQIMCSTSTYLLQSMSVKQAKTAEMPPSSLPMRKALQATVSASEYSGNSQMSPLKTQMKQSVMLPPKLRREQYSSLRLWVLMGLRKLFSRVFQNCHRSSEPIWVTLWSKRSLRLLGMVELQSISLALICHSRLMNWQKATCCLRTRTQVREKVREQRRSQKSCRQPHSQCERKVFFLYLAIMVLRTLLSSLNLSSWASLSASHLNYSRQRFLSWKLMPFSMSYLTLMQVLMKVLQLEQRQLTQATGISRNHRMISPHLMSIFMELQIHNRMVVVATATIASKYSTVDVQVTSNGGVQLSRAGQTCRQQFRSSSCQSQPSWMSWKRFSILP